MLRRHGTSRTWTKHSTGLTTTLIFDVPHGHNHLHTYTQDLWLTNTAGTFHHTTVDVVTEP